MGAAENDIRLDEALTRESAPRISFSLFSPPPNFEMFFPRRRSLRGDAGNARRRETEPGVNNG